MAPVTERTNNSEFEVTCEALRSTFPPASPNFPFIPLTDFGDETAINSVALKIMGLLLRPSNQDYMKEYNIVVVRND